MSLLRGLLFDNLGLKLVALLLALVVYLNVYTDRPATMVVSFPIQVTDLPDSLAVVDVTPQAVAAELRGTGKQLIRLRVTEPPVKISLAGVAVGHFERALGPEDLPLPAGVQVQVDRMVSPRLLSMRVDRRETRRLPVAPRVIGEAASGVILSGRVVADPVSAEVTGPASVVSALDSLALEPVTIAGRRDTLQETVGIAQRPSGTRLDPEEFEVTVPLEAGITRRVTVAIESPRAAVESYAVTPDRVTMVVTGPRRSVADADLGGLRAHWTAAQPLQAFVGRRVPVRREGALPAGARVRLEPDSVTLRRVTP